MTTKPRAFVPSTTWWPMTNGWKQSSFPSAMASRCCGNDRNFGRRSYTTAMKYLIASLFLFLWEHSSLSGHPCYIGTEEYNNVVVEQKDSVLRGRISSNRFEEIRIVHKEEACLRNLKRSPYWEISEYGQKQKAYSNKWNMA